MQAGFPAPYVAPSSLEGGLLWCTKCGKHWVLFKISFSSVCFSGFQGTTIMMVEGLLVELWVGSIHNEGWFAPAVL